MKPVKPVGALLFPAVCTVGFCLGLEAGSFQYVLLKIAAEVSLDKTMMGSLVSVQFFGVMICPLLAGRISDRVSKKRIAAIFLLVFSAGCLLCGKSPGTGAFMAGIFVVGGAFTTAQNATIAALTDVYGTRSGKYVNICQCLYSFGAVSGPILASGLIAVSYTHLVTGGKPEMILHGLA